MPIPFDWKACQNREVVEVCRDLAPHFEEAVRVWGNFTQALHVLHVHIQKIAMDKGISGTAKPAMKLDTKHTRIVEVCRSSDYLCYVGTRIDKELANIKPDK